MGEIKPNFFAPAQAFNPKTGDALPSAAPWVAPAPLLSASAPAAAFVPEVLVYTSPTNRSYFDGAGLDARINTRLWEIFLRKYRFPHKLVTDIAAVESAPASVLVLPSSVALNARERQAIVDFQAKGGSVLATWMTGVRDESGAWRGFGYMESAFQVKVVGSTIAAKDDNFINTWGDSPVTHALPAGQRVWTERAKEWYPLRLTGANVAAQIWDWSRTAVPGKVTTAMTYDERRTPNGASSRTVVMGWPERLWMASDPKQMEGIVHNTMTWLLRRPAAYLAAWPHPYRSAAAISVYTADFMNDNDMPFALSVEKLGMRATYYLVSFEFSKSEKTAKQLQSRGHELGFMADKFEGFKDQPAADQARRIQTMRDELKKEGVPIADDAGFFAPMDSVDKNTSRLLAEQNFDFHLAFMDASDGRLPVIVQGGGPTRAKPLVVLPRTQRAPEEMMAEGDELESLKIFETELDVTDKVGGFAAVHFPNQTLIGKETQDELFGFLNARRSNMWLSTAGRVSDWWRERERVSFNLSGDANSPTLTVDVTGTQPLRYPARILINLPTAGAGLRVSGGASVLPSVARVDGFRAAVVLLGLMPGRHQWQISFEAPAAR